MEENIYPVSKPCPCYDKNGVKIGWHNPRYPATALFAFVWSKEKNGWCVLVSERGKGSESFQGTMNCACGYLDINVTLKQNAVKETSEECGVDIDPNSLIPCGIEDSPSAYAQHLTHRFCTILDKDASVYAFSHDGNEVNEQGDLEVGDIFFIPLSEVTKYNWAFGHGDRISEIANFLHLQNPIVKFCKKHFNWNISLIVKRMFIWLYNK